MLKYMEAKTTKDLISVEEVRLSVAKQMMVEDLCFEVCRVRNGALVHENDQRGSF